MIRFLVASCFIVMFFHLSSCSRFCGCESGEDISTYFERIRNEQALVQFMKRMPKGGDLHNHFSGSVYAESYWEQIVQDDFLIDTTSLLVQRPLKNKEQKYKRPYVRMSYLKLKKRLPIYREKLFRAWSIKNYSGGAADDHFFATFSKFPDNDSSDMIRNLKELRTRAITENVQYIEIMLSSSKIDLRYALTEKAKEKTKEKIEQLEQEFKTCQSKRACNFDSLLSAQMSFYHSQEIFKTNVAAFIDTMKTINKGVGSNPEFAFRYLAYIRREAEPGELFRNLLLAFEEAEQSDIVVGVNIVEREDGTRSMNDYKLHMKMFEFLSKKYPNVKLSLHAGELTAGSVRPEDLTFHIHDAVFTACADRIGHGVDLAYEDDRENLLTYMRDHPVPVEINLTSNEFILGVKGEAHPLTLYRKHNVPYVISTDDAGILRTDLTQQYVLLVQRYPSVSYDEIKTVVMNSIEYSFLDDKDKAIEKKSLLDRFAVFEKKMAERLTHLKKTDDRE